MGFLLALFEGFRVQIGVPFTEQIIQRLMSIFTGDQLAETILQDGSLGAKVVEKFIGILKLIVQEPGSSFKSLLPSIITLAMEQIYPIIAEVSETKEMSGQIIVAGLLITCCVLTDF